ncbi:transport permease protein [Catellatospora sp. TT07R-123]|uniref:ABC transporter permease n=1 Tax=Catellatospora sp. TT07R-123 TaxID=2733863 RepID=UPI001B19CEAC|nr:ABC transporter permease [Catellatospora sp. TT07R-123]GHJ47534.1 transport permease protein [Catellatospora sp. TT07R-123]
MSTIAAPTPRRAAGRPWWLVERHLRVYRKSWSVFIADLTEPLLYLVAIGLGVGSLVGDVAGTGVPYAQYVAPALLATSAMNGAMNEASSRVFMRIKVEKTYQTMITTPMTVTDIQYGEIAWAILRGLAGTGGFLAAAAAFGLIRSPYALLALPAAALVGFAFAACGLLVATLLRSWYDYLYLQLFMLPMFLFATTFYPLEVYPAAFRPVVQALPLYHAVTLLRQVCLGRFDLHAAAAVAYLLLLGLAASALAAGRWRRMLQS